MSFVAQGFETRSQAIRAAFLFALLFGVTFYNWDKLVALNVQLGPDSPQPSAWIEREKQLFSQTLHANSYDVLIVPFQATGATNVDRVARSLMTRLLAQQIQQRTDLRVPDPSWVMKALGATARTYANDETKKLAQRIGAKIIISGYVERLPGSSSMTLRIFAEQREASNGSTWKAAPPKEWRDITFDDNLPPAQAYKAILDDLVTQLPLENLAAPAQPLQAVIVSELPDKPLTLAQGTTSSAVEKALALQLYASLHEVGDIEGEHLWERSLIALEQAAPDSDYYDLLKARAFFHLHHRPYALKLLGNDSTAEGAAFSGILLGNLALAEANAGKIENKALRLIAKIELEDLRAAYGKIQGYQKRRVAIFKELPQYVTLLSLRLSQGDWFNKEMHEEIARQLDAVHVAAPALPKSNVLTRLWASLKQLYFIRSGGNSAATQMANAVELRRPAHLLKIAQGGAALAAQDQLTEWDYFDLLYAINRAAAVKTASGVIFRQGRFDAGLEIIEGLQQGFRDYPQLTYREAYATLNKARRQDSGQNPRLLAHSSRLARDAYLWEGGETNLSGFAEQLLHEHPYLKYDDEPMRPYRVEVPHSKLVRISTQTSREVLEQQVIDYTRKLAYTQTDFSIFKNLIGNLHELGRDDEATALFAQNEQRFAGADAREAFISAELGKTGNSSAALKFYQDALKNSPDVWGNYYQAGLLLIGSGHHQEAQQLFLSYPPFHDSTANAVASSNYARDAARRLFSAGEPKLSIPLFELALSFGTGSAAEMESAELLAFMQGDFRQALAFSQLRLRRYNDRHAASSSLAYLFLTGHDAEAWKQFNTLFARFPGTALLPPPFIAHRIQGLGGKAIQDWVLGWEAAPGMDQLVEITRTHYAFMALYIDRPTSEEALPIMQALTQRHGDTAYLNLAIGYSAIKAEKYPAAIAALTDLSNNLTNVSVSQKLAANYVLPYLTFAHLKAGQKGIILKVLSDYRNRIGENFDYLISQAFVMASAGDHASALDLLQRAFNQRPGTGDRPFFTLYQLIEAGEFLYQDTHEEAYAKLVLDWARRGALMSHYSWTYAVEAKHTTSPEERKKALGIALYLDSQSEHIQHFSADEKTAAKAWFNANNPFGVARKDTL